MSGRIDAHLHLWRRSRGDYGWLTPSLRALWRDFEPSDAWDILQANGIDQAVLVQAAPTEAETRFLLDIAESHNWVAGAVGWIDFEGDDPCSVLEDFRSNPRFLGIRPMLQDLLADDWILDPRFAQTLTACAEWGLAFDALIRPSHLRVVRALLERHPNLRLVIDHGAKPNIEGGDLRAWKHELHRLARETHAYVKLSGLVTEAGDMPSIERIGPAAEIILELFGTDRVIWGSDWPVCTTASSYEAWLRMSERLLSGIDSGARNAIFGGNARIFYRLGGKTH